MAENKTLGGRLLEAMTDKGWGLFQFSQACGIREATLRTWIGDSCEPLASSLGKACRALEVNMDWVLTGEGRKES